MQSGDLRLAAIFAVAVTFGWVLGGVTTGMESLGERVIVGTAIGGASMGTLLVGFHAYDVWKGADQL